MLRMMKKTWLIFLLQLLLYLTVPISYWAMFRAAFLINSAYLSWAPMNILLPAAVILCLSVASVYSLIIVKAVGWYLNQILVVAVTVYVNGLEYKGSLTGFAFNEVNNSLLIFSAKSVISRKTFRWLKTVKNSLLNKEIMQGLFNHKWLVVRKSLELIKLSMSNTLDMADEVLVSYTWLTTYIYKLHGPDGRKPKTTKLLRNQAKFFLEGFMNYIRCFPKLVISTFFPTIGYGILMVSASLAVVVAAFFVFGLSWWNVLWVLFFFQSLCAWLENLLFQYGFTIITLDKFYKLLRTMEPISMDSLVQTISGIPIFAKIAKQTGIKEFKGMKFEEVCPSTLLELTAVEEMLGSECTKICDLFDVNIDELKEEEPESESEEMPATESEENTEETPNAENEENTVEEPATESEEGEVLSGVITVTEDEDEENFFYEGKAEPTIRHVKPFEL